MASGELEVVVFEIGGLLYALPAASVRELVRAVAIVPPPRAPAIVEGIINLRGKVVPVLDVRAPVTMLGLAKSNTSNNSGTALRNTGKYTLRQVAFVLK